MSDTIGEDLKDSGVDQFNEAKDIQDIDPDMSSGPGSSKSIKDILLTSTGNGDMSSIVKDDQKTPLGHILRGIEGFISELTGQNRGDLAILDVLIGVLKMFLGQQGAQAGGDTGLEPR